MLWDVGIETFLLKDQLINRTNEAPLLNFKVIWRTYIVLSRNSEQMRGRLPCR